MSGPMPVGSLLLLGASPVYTQSAPPRLPRLTVDTCEPPMCFDTCPNPVLFALANFSVFVSISVTRFRRPFSLR